MSCVFPYKDIRWIPPTSNRLVRFCSRVEFIYRGYRQRLLSENLEAQLLLTANRSFWNREIVQTMHNGEKKMKTFVALFPVINAT